LPEPEAQAWSIERRSTDHANTRFVALGRRWLIPQENSLGQHTFSGWEPYRASSRVAWAAMKTALRWPGARRLPPCCQTTFEWLSELDWRALGWHQPSPPYPLVYLGTPGAKRKAVVHLIDRDSKRCELIVKVPLTEAAKEAIAAEAETLIELQSEGFVDAPRLVVFDPANSIASQSVVPGRRCGLQFNREVAELLQRLLRRGETITLRETAAWLPRAAGATNKEDSDLPARALEQLDDATELPAARVHGDFAPWNIKLHEGSAALVDWEEYRPRGLPLHDAYHFVHLTRYLFGRRPRPCWQDLRFRYSMPLSSAIRWKLELAYLLHASAKELARSDRQHATFLLKTLCLTMAAQP